MTNQPDLAAAIRQLDSHFQAFQTAAGFARSTLHPVPVDTRGWSQILVSTLTGIPGKARQKGPDLADGSDVKGALTWEAIDTPRFNGVIKAGTNAEYSDRIESLDGMPNLYFVLWDQTIRDTYRCRVWVVRASEDAHFRAMCGAWYDKRSAGAIKSTNFQLHPPRGLDTNVFRNTCGNLCYPLFFSAERPEKGTYNNQAVYFDSTAPSVGICRPASSVVKTTVI